MANNTKLYDVYDWNDQLVCGNVSEKLAAKIMLTYDGYDFGIKPDVEWDPYHTHYVLYIKNPDGKTTPYKNGYRYESLDEIWGGIVMNGYNGLWAKDQEMRKDMHITSREIVRSKTITDTHISFSEDGDIDFADCFIKDVSMYREWINNVTFVDCMIKNINLRRSRMNGVYFKNCTLRNIDFSNADMKDVEFTDCSIYGSDFSGVSMEKVTFRGKVTLTQSTLAED